MHNWELRIGRKKNQCMRKGKERERKLGVRKRRKRKQNEI